MIKPHEYPVIGTWYRDLEHKDKFEIVAIDEKNQAIEIQYFSGDIEEIDYDEWFSMKIGAIPAPQDWSGPFEVEKDEFSDLSDEPPHPSHRPEFPEQ
jgi:hypothetical protein